MNKVTLILDLQFGSTGKGKVAGRIAEDTAPDVVINANMPNAGHTYINSEGRTWIHKVLPNGIVSPGLKYVGLGPGSVFSIDQLRAEMENSADFLLHAKLVIHEAAVVLTEAHKTAEAGFDRIGSTKQGSAEAVIEKMRRDPSSVVIAKDALKGTEFEHCVITNAGWLQMLYDARDVLAEGAQGYSLGINAGFWPYCTSRDCTTTRLMSEMGIPPFMIKNIIGVARTYPIRVGGTSGGCYSDQREINWEDIGKTPELTTVTKKQRRIFTYSSAQMREAIMACHPTGIVLNFADYCNEPELNRIIKDIEEVGQGIGLFSNVLALGTGGGYDDWIDLTPRKTPFYSFAEYLNQ